MKRHVTRSGGSLNGQFIRETYSICTGTTIQRWPMNSKSMKLNLQQFGKQTNSGKTAVEGNLKQHSQMQHAHCSLSQMQHTHGNPRPSKWFTLEVFLRQFQLWVLFVVRQFLRS